MPQHRLMISVLAMATLLAVAAAPGRALEGFDDPLPPELRAWANEHGPLRIGYVRTTAPMSVIEDDRVVGGYAFELHSLMAIRLGLELESVVFDGPGMDVEALTRGEIDLIAGLGNRPDVVAVAEPAEPIAWVPLQFVARDPGRIDIEALEGRSVTTIPGSVIEARLADDFPELDYRPTPSIPDGLRAVADGDVDLYLGPLAVVGWQLRQIGLSLGPVGDAVDVVTVSPWTLPDSEAGEILRIGRQLLTDSEMAVVHVRWTGFDLTDPTASGGARWLLPALLIAVGLVLVLTLFSWILHRRVNAATADLRSLNAELEGRVAERTADLSRANNQLVDSNQALTDFARTVAHDLRGPVAAISGMSTLLRTIEVDDQQAEEMLTSIESSSLRLGGMIDRLLDDAVRAGGREPTLTGAEFGQWLTEVTAPELTAIGGSLELDLPEGSLDVDLRILRRGALNLVGNAIKYAASPTGTQIIVRLATDGQGMTSLTVDDNGPGIPEHEREQVFTRGHQRVGDGRGRGLGLADIRDLAHAAGGSVEVGDSELGGARFVLTIPATDARSEARLGGAMPDQATDA